MKRIKAYTLMEVTIAMLLSALCISVCYTAYGIIGKYYHIFQEKNEKADAVLSVRHVLESDFLKSRYVLKTDSGLEMQSDRDTIFYRFSPQSIVRELFGSHIDTFKTENEDLHFFFEGTEIQSPDTVDRMEMKLLLDQNKPVNIRVDKKYSAENLLN